MKKISEFTLKIALLFLPGLISYVIIEKLTFHKKHETHQVGLYSFILGLLCYGFYYEIIQILSMIGYQFNFVFTSTLTDGSIKFTLIWEEIINVTFLSIVIGVLTSFIINHGYPHKLLRDIKVTKKGTFEDVWLSAMCKGWDPYVEITDFKNDRTYVGWIDTFSEYGPKEVLLRDVIVEEQKSKKFLYKTPAVYLLLKDNFTIEFASAPYYDEPSTPERTVINVESERTSTPNTTSKAAATTTDTDVALAQTYTGGSK